MKALNIEIDDDLKDELEKIRKNGIPIRTIAIKAIHDYINRLEREGYQILNEKSQLTVR